MIYLHMTTFDVALCQITVHSGSMEITLLDVSKLTDKKRSINYLILIRLRRFVHVRIFPVSILEPRPFSDFCFIQYPFTKTTPS